MYVSYEIMNYSWAAYLANLLCGYADSINHKYQLYGNPICVHFVVLLQYSMIAVDPNLFFHLQWMMSSQNAWMSTSMQRKRRHTIQCRHHSHLQCACGSQVTH